MGSRFKDRGLGAIKTDERGGAEAGAAGVRKENIKFWHVEVHVQVRFKNLLHFSRARQGFGQTSYNENIVTNAHHPVVG